MQTTLRSATGLNIHEKDYHIIAGAHENWFCKFISTQGKFLQGSTQHFTAMADTWKISGDEIFRRHQWNISRPLSKCLEECPWHAAPQKAIGWIDFALSIFLIRAPILTSIVATASLYYLNRYEDEINKRTGAENEFVVLKKVRFLCVFT